MINATNGQLVFLKTGAALQSDTRAALESAALAVLKLLNLETLDIGKVTTKSHYQAAYAKFILGHTLRQDAKFDEGYVNAAWNFYSTEAKDITHEQFYALTLGATGTEFAFKQSYVKPLRRGAGLFLVALHCRGALTLPMRFEWPPSLAEAGRATDDLGIFGELLGFIRLLDSKTEDLPHPAFQSVGTSRKRREWFLCYGTKFLLATGWLKPQDARIEDILELRSVDGTLGVSPGAHIYKALIDVLRSRYGTSFGITVEQWSEKMRSAETKALRVSVRLGLNTQAKEYASDEDVLYDALKTSPVMATPQALRARPRLPGLATALPDLANKWLELEDVYMRIVKRESYKPVKQALGYFNIYLFFYLSYWFQRRPTTELQFPDVPRKLSGGVFVARLLEPALDAPIPLTDFMNLVGEHRKWANSSLYGVLKQLEVFFAFIELHGDDLPGCVGFKQPIPDYVYPATARSKGTNKRPIPRRIFGVFLDYIDALRAHLSVVLQRALSGELDVLQFERSLSRSGNVIDTFATASLVGFVPVLFARGRTVPLQYIPNCLNLATVPLKTGRRIKLPQPHSLNQILVALYTGLRHNHIQWLDTRNFDAEVTDDNKDFALLHVNTDKSMRKAWTPHVNFAVISALRSQRAWRELIGFPGFEVPCHYNNNPNTKWPPILPLFSADEQGMPHSDNRYTRVWQDILCAVDALLPRLGELGMQRLCVLEPPGVTMDDPAAVSKRRAYGMTCKNLCELGVKSLITPHSTRVTVVSQYSTLLPAETIGSRITGQTPGVVYHYVKLDEEQLLSAQTHQAMNLRERAYRSEFEALVGGKSVSRSYIRADDVNSNFAKGLRSNLQETLVSYGCVSITMNEDATSGLDVLRETRAANAAENKTEICPYGNHCPPEIIKQWQGTRRCGLCQYAVRSIDHLPAVSAKVKEFTELLDALTTKVASALSASPPPYTDAEFDRLDEERSRIAEELTGWRLCEEVLDAARRRIANGQDTRRWLVPKPEVILQDLQRVEAPSNLTAYVLARLGECISYPTCESPQIRARFDILRRELLACGGQVRKAFDLTPVADPAGECAGLLRTLVEANKLSYQDVINLLENDGQYGRLPSSSPATRLLLEGE